MSFDEEWAQHQANAAQHSTSMELNQLPGGSGSSGSGRLMRRPVPWTADPSLVGVVDQFRKAEAAV